jgi:hypothetical protein
MNKPQIRRKSAHFLSLIHAWLRQFTPIHVKKIGQDCLWDKMPVTLMIGKMSVRTLDFDPLPGVAMRQPRAAISPP